MKISALPTATTPLSGAELFPLVQSGTTRRVTLNDLLRSIGNGTAAAPALAPGGDPNTGIYFPAADTIGFVEGGVEVMRLDSSGRLGLGTSVPGAKLDVVGLSRSGGDATHRGDIVIQQSANVLAGAGGIELKPDGANNGYGARIQSVFNGVSSYDLSFQLRNNSASWTQRMLLDSNGNLGLGATPSAWSVRALQIGATTAVWQESASAFLSANVYFDGSNRYISTAAASRYEQNAGSHRWFSAASGTAGNAITFTQAMTLDANGNLGVGTATPVNVASGSVTIDIAATTSRSASLWLHGNNQSGTTTGFLLQSDTVSDAYVWNYANRPLYFGTNNVSRWTILSSGHFVAGVDNTYDIGASGATRPRNVYAGTSVVAPKGQFTGVQDGLLSQFDQNGESQVATFRNANNSTGATTLVAIGNDVSATAARLQLYGSGYTTSGLAIADSLRLNNNRPGGITVSSTDASGVVRFVTGGTASTNERMRVKSGGQLRFVPLAAAPTTNVEDGDVYYDSGTNKLRVRAGGAWTDLH
jgi:hypothetical protein